MIPVSSNLENKVFPLYELEKQLKPLGYVIGGNWDFQEGSFDYKMSDEGGYQFVRIPFEAEEGSLDSPGVIVRLGNPFILTHVFQAGVENHSDNGVIQGAFNQFQSPVDEDADVPERYVEKGKRLIEQIEHLLL
ncbi:YugN-like family protein [Aquibacillus saliphilus]|uniref:YugN-like family protein n=1 Tax=Aquibacillus saliphilus TaxID=1909422 RepID=UPI001CEFD369|nr:YugN-like family protein [Aquibacillus saliphilus]